MSERPRRSTRSVAPKKKEPILFDSDEEEEVQAAVAVHHDEDDDSDVNFGRDEEGDDSEPEEDDSGEDDPRYGQNNDWGSRRKGKAVGKFKAASAPHESGRKTTTTQKTPLAKKTASKPPKTLGQASQPKQLPKGSLVKTKATIATASGSGSATGTTSTSTIDPHVIEPYPTVVLNRSYQGPMKRFRATPYILDYFYGPHEADIRVAASFVSRWHPLNVLPLARTISLPASHRRQRTGTCKDARESMPPEKGDNTNGNENHHVHEDEHENSDNHEREDRGPMPSPWMSQEAMQREEDAWQAIFQSLMASDGVQRVEACEASQQTHGSTSLTAILGLPLPPHQTEELIELGENMPIPLNDIGYPIVDSSTTDSSRSSSSSSSAPSAISSPTNPQACTENDFVKAWLLYTDQVVLATEWAPQATKHRTPPASASTSTEKKPDGTVLLESTPQVLAVVTAPHLYGLPIRRSPTPDKTQDSRLHLWQVASAVHPTSQCLGLSKNHQPQRLASFNIPWGRPRLLKWCPATPPPLSSSPVNTSTKSLFSGVLALLCDDGKVRIFCVASADGGDKDNVSVHHSMTLATGLQPAISITTFCWASLNRIVTGHSDGTIGLWTLCTPSPSSSSAQPPPLLPRPSLLFRHVVHTSTIVEVASGYPSQPHLVLSVPLAGLPTLVDLRRPSAELTAWVTPSVAPLARCLDWQDHLQGFFFPHPSSNALDTSVVFGHARYFPRPRHVMTSSSAVSCVAASTGHPFVLVGHVDGSLWCCNAAKKVFITRHEATEKLKLVSHTYRPIFGTTTRDDSGSGSSSDLVDPGDATKAVVHIAQGWSPELNTSDRKVDFAPSIKGKAGHGDSQLDDSTNTDKGNAKTGAQKAESTPAKKKAGTSAKGGGSTRRKRPTATSMADADEEENDDGSDDNNNPDGDNDSSSRGLVNHDVRTRVVTTRWNPNVGYETWAAVGYGSGVIRIMDLSLNW